jgi:dipeptidyl-peptidase-4
MLFAQRNLTVAEATYGQYTTFATERVANPNWKNNNSFSFVVKTGDTLMLRSLENKWESKKLLTATELETALNAYFKNTSFKIKRVPANLQWENDKEFSFITQDTEGKNNYLITYNTVEQKVVKSFKYAVEGRNELVSRNKDYIAWLKDNNIVVSNSKGNDIQVTNDPALEIINGSEDTHRQEFGIKQGMWWSPKQDQLMYYRKDQSMVTNYPLIQWQERVATVKNIKYPMAGMTNEKVSLVIFDIYTNKKVTLQTGDADQFLTMVTWDPSGNFVYVGVLNREQNHYKVNQYNVATGAFEKTLFEEKAATYAEPSNSLVFVPGSDNTFIHFSEKDGYRQMYLYNTDGKLVQKLGFNNVIVSNLIGFDKDGKNAFYTGVTNQGLDRQTFKVNLKSGKTTQLTTTTGTHTSTFNADKSYMFDVFSDVNTPYRFSITNVDNKKEVEILNAKDPLKGKINMADMKLITLTAADGKTPLNGRIYYPTNFDATKKYPVMVYVYGGPHAQLITNSWLGGGNLFFHYMAQNGYVVFTVDNRGSHNRGRDFEHVIHRQLGQAEMADQMKGIEYLKKQSFVDADRIGVYGWSFGGFMTTTLSLAHPEVFKVGVAGGPVMDWAMYEIMYGERYMDTPQENPEGYKLTNLVKKADKIDNKLLIIHGAQDPVVVQQHSMEFIESAIKAKKQVDYFLYPSHEHNVMGIDRAHLNEKIANYFFDYLAKPNTAK